MSPLYGMHNPVYTIAFPEIAPGRWPKTLPVVHISLMQRFFRVWIAATIIVLGITPAVYPRGMQEPSLPSAPDLVSGRLESGMDYFVWSNGWPENRVVLRLVVNAGSVQEQEHERGLAHFVEHMAFNGTELFPRGELVRYLESLGMRFGPDVNAYTSFDETVYKLDLPADDPAALERGFRVLEQWSQAVTFPGALIETERGVIVEEWRRGRGAQARMLDQHIPVLLQDSRYALRLPIGDMEIIRTASRDDLVGYYRRWYRPDNMAVIAVGDLPAADLEELVQRHLGRVAPVPHYLQREYHSVPRLPGTRISIAADREATRSTVALYLPRDPLAFRTAEDYRAMLVRSLLASILNERLRDLARDAASPILSGGAGWTRFVRDTEISVISAVAQDGRTVEATELLAREVERVRRFGVLPSEVERARGRFLQAIEEAWVNAANRPSSSLADELVRHWTQGEPVPGIAREYELYGELLPGISAEEVSAAVSFFNEEDGLVVLVGLREDGSPVPDEGAIRQALSVSDVFLTPPADDEEITELITQSQTSGSILQEIHHEAVDTRELILENGMRVFVRQTDIRDDEIVVSLFQRGGLSQVDEHLVPAARLMSAVLQESGAGPFSAPQLQRFLSRKSVELAPRVLQTTGVLSGSTRRNDLETLFQLVVLAVTEPRVDPNALETVRRSTLQSIRGAQASPQGQFSRRFQELYAAGDPRLAPLDPRDVEGITAEMVDLIARRQWNDPREMALFVVGSVSPEEVAQLSATWLAGIPSRDTEARADGAPPPVFRHDDEVRTEVVRAGSEDVAQVGMIFHSDYQWSREENHRLNTLADVMNIRLREVLREEQGGTYGVGAASWRQRLPIPRAFVQVFFGMDPARSQELINRTLDVIAELREELVSPDILERVRAQQRESYRQSVRDNSYWLATLQFAHEHHRDFATIPEFPRLIEAVTREEIRETARAYLDPQRRLQLLLLPQE